MQGFQKQKVRNNKQTCKGFLYKAETKGEKQKTKDKKQQTNICRA